MKPSHVMHRYSRHQNDCSLNSAAAEKGTGGSDSIGDAMMPGLPFSGMRTQ